MATIASTAAKRANPKLVATFNAPEVEVAEAAELLISETGDPVAVAPTPAITGPLSGVRVSLPLRAFALARNSVYVLVSFAALILPTIPNEQWLTCLQKNQMGVVSVMLMVKVTADCKPESNPAEAFDVVFAARYVHGFAKVD